MKRRSKENSIYWQRRREQMFKEYPDSKYVKSRYKAIAWLLLEKYPRIVNSADIKVMCEFLKNADYLNRKIRWETEDVDKVKKKILSQQYQIEELNYQPINKELEKELDRLL